MTETAQRFFPAAACAQLHIALGDAGANLSALEGLLAARPPIPGSLVLLPEMWASGFVFGETARLAAETPELLENLKKLAARYHIFLAGSLTALEQGQSLPLNRLYLVGPEGLLGQADKQFLFAAWQEDRHFRPGRASLPMATPMGPVGALVCYDLRFPEISRELAFAGCRLLIVAAEWPLSRLAHWRALTQARAIENQCYVVACNACGQTGGLIMAGHSRILGPGGEVLAEAGAEPGLVVAPLDAAALDAQRHLFCAPAERPWRGSDSGKLCTLAEVLPRLAALRGQGSRIAFTNGCFDLLHAGHVTYLEEARRSADCLVLGLNSDASVRAQGKGRERPVNPEADRARVLAALGCVDFIVPFDAPTPLALIRAILPDVLVKGADWPEEQIAGAAEVLAAGGRVLRIPLSPGRSTTAIIRRIAKHVAG